MEFIARVLVNREGKPWIMRRRTQAEMDQLVAAAGFEKVAMEIDQWGIFTVSLARRKAYAVDNQTAPAVAYKSLRSRRGNEWSWPRRGICRLSRQIKLV
jgi:hypothetical protein